MQAAEDAGVEALLQEEVLGRFQPVIPESKHTAYKAGRARRKSAAFIADFQTDVQLVLSRFPEANRFMTARPASIISMATRIGPNGWSHTKAVTNART